MLTCFQLDLLVLAGGKPGSLEAWGSGDDNRHERGQPSMKGLS